MSRTSGTVIDPYRLVGFPESTFRLDVDPAAIRRSLLPYRSFATAAKDAAEKLSSLTIDSWTGAEGDLYRARRVAFSPMMTQAQTSFAKAGTEIETFTVTLETLIRRMEALRPQAQATWNRLYSLVPVEGPPSGITVARERAFSPSVFSPGYADRQAWDRHVAEADRIRRELAEAAARTASAIRAVPPPPPVPSAAAMASTAANHAQMPPLVTERLQGDLVLTGVMNSVLAKKGWRAEVERLDNGRLIVRLFKQAALGLEGGPSAYVGAGLETGAVFGAELTARGYIGGEEGTVVEMNESDLPKFIFDLGILGRDPASVASDSKTKWGKHLGSSVVVEAEGRAEVPFIMELAGEANGRADLDTDVFYDGSTVVTLAVAGAVKREAGYGDPSKTRREPGALAPRRSGPGRTKRTGSHAARGPDRETSAKGDPGQDAWWEKGAKGGASVTVRTSKDGASTATFTTRTESVEDKTVVEHQTTRVVSAEEARAINEAVKSGDPQEVATTIDPIVRDLAAGEASTDPAVEHRTLEYEVDDTKGGAEGKAGAGVVYGLKGEGQYRHETLTSVDGVKQ